MKKAFVNRIEEMRHLNQALTNDGKENELLVFTGIGGMGKTALRIAFEEQILKPKSLAYAVLDYDGDPNLRPIESTLRAIRRQLGRHGVKTPVFDYLYARYFELSTGLKLSTKNYPIELEGVVNILAGIPFVGNVTQILYGLSQLGLKVKERVQHKDWFYRMRDLEPHEVLNLLPEILAEDLEEAMTSQTPKVLKTSGCRVVLLIDAYERLSESKLDDTLHRKLILLSPHLLRVIFTRDPLAWEHKFPEEWRGKITHFPTLDDLSQEDARAFLQEKNIEDPDLQEHLYQLTGGYPLHLELCTDIYHEIEVATNRKAEIQDFEGAVQTKNLTEELVHRLLRQLKDDERDLMGLAACPRWISEEVLEILSSVPESVPRIFKKLISLSMFSPHVEIAEAYVMRKEVRDCLILQQRKERLFEQRHGKLAQFHQEKWQETQTFHHLLETMYHRFYENLDEALKIFDEHFWKFLEKFSFGEAEAFIETIPLDKLNENAKRRVDYARARLLTTRERSQQDLMIAKTLYEKLIASETNEEFICQFLFYFGNLLFEMGEYEKSLQYHKKALTMRRKIYGEAHPELARSYHYMGNIYRETGEYEKALLYNNKSLAIKLQASGENDPSVAGSYGNIAVVYAEKGAYSKALEYYQKALGIHLKVFGEDHPDVANTYNNIGLVYEKKGEYEKAQVHHRNALAIRLKVYGENHPRVADSYNNIGIIYQRKSDYQEAMDYYGKALVLWQKTFGEKHPRVAIAYLNIGIAYYYQVEYEKSLEYLQKALAIWLTAYGEKHPNVAICYKNIGELYSKWGEYDKTLEYLLNALAIFRNVYGEEHSDVADSYKEIANMLFAMRKEEEAFAKLRKSIEIYCRINQWRDAVEVLDTLTAWLEQKGRKKEAEEARAEAQKIRRDQGLS